jgi:hypothetical protein
LVRRGYKLFEGFEDFGVREDRIRFSLREGLGFNEKRIGEG